MKKNYIQEYKKGNNIHIKPENKGKFTATKKKTGKSTEELTHSKNPLTRKRAIFAQNAKKWKHNNGGIIRKHQEGGNLEFLTDILTEYQKGGSLSKDYIKEARKKPGGSNVGKYNMNQTFAGPSGGAPKGSYPIGDLHHAKSALKLAHNAPNPSGIKSAVYRKYPELKKQDGGDINYTNLANDQNVSQNQLQQAKQLGKENEFWRTVYTNRLNNKANEAEFLKRQKIGFKPMMPIKSMGITPSFDMSQILNKWKVLK